MPFEGDASPTSVTTKLESFLGVSHLWFICRWYPVLRPASDVPKEIIRYMSCAIKQDPPFLRDFMNSKNKTRNLIEFAAFMAHVGQETGDLQTIWEQFG